MANIVLQDALKMVSSYVPEQAKVIAWGKRAIEVISSGASQMAPGIVRIMKKEETKVGCNAVAGLISIFVGVRMLFGSSSSAVSAAELRNDFKAMVLNSPVEDGEVAEPEVQELDEEEPEPETTESNSKQKPAVSDSSLNAPMAASAVQSQDKVQNQPPSTNKGEASPSPTPQMKASASLVSRFVKTMLGLTCIVAGGVALLDAYSRSTKL